MNDSVAWFASNNGVSTDIYRANVRKPEDPNKVAVNSLLEEATSMVADLTDDTYDSLQSFSQSIFVSFENNTAVLSPEAVTHLDEAVALIKEHKKGKLKLIAYVNTYGSDNGQLWDKRLEEIRNYLRQKSGLDLMIDHEIVKTDISQSARAGVVEVRYN
jgi:outer membrane protein OmpA-like peptidoglycan-associated protein